MECYGSAGLTGVIRKLGERLIGWDPRPVEKITAYLHGVTRQAAGGIASRRSRRSRTRWSTQGKGAGHPGLRDAGRAGARPSAALLVALRHLADQPCRADQGVDRVRSDALARRRGARRRARWRRAASRGSRPTSSASTGPAQHAHAGLPRPRLARAERRPGHRRRAGRRRLAAFRQGAGPEMGILLDLNFNFKTEGYIKLARRWSRSICSGWRSTATTRRRCA